MQVGAVRVDVSDHVQESVGLSSGSDHEGSSSIDDGSAEESEDARASRGVLAVDRDGAQSQLPVGLRHDGHLLEGTSVVAGVNASELDGGAHTSGL